LLVLESAARAGALVERVPDGPAAEEIRESFRCLERGDVSEVQAEKLAWYSKGRTLAEAAVRQAEGSSDAHFALFANWGRIVLIEGVFWNARNLPKLRAHLDRALELEPDHPDALAAKGTLYFRLPPYLGGDATKAEALLLRSIRLDPNSPRKRLELADYYLEANRREEALSQAQAVLDIARTDGKEIYARRAQELIEGIGPVVQKARYVGR
jgi:tetratricopeptide (TPR) repeat protein